jgi:hypothetical protein
VCPTNDEASRINDQKLQEIDSDPIKFEAQDTVLNNFDFSSRAQQKEGLTDEVLILKKGMDILFIPENSRRFIKGSVVGFEHANSKDWTDEMKKQCRGLKSIETAVKEWSSKHVSLPIVRLDTGEVKTIPFRVFVVHAMRKAVAWRVQLPLRPAYAISLYKSQQMLLDSVSVLEVN